MDRCQTCEGLSERFNIATPDEYRDTARQLIGMVSRGSLFLMRADYPLEEILEPTLPGDIVVHDFECSACGREFKLSADTYHGNAHWTPGELSESRSNLSKPN